MQNSTIKFFLPDWEDRIDPNFDFNLDEYSVGHKTRNGAYKNDIYAHQIYESNPPYDGVLFSLSIFKSKLKLSNNPGEKVTIRKHDQIKDYLKFPPHSKLQTMADCGAFSYVRMHEPPQDFFNTENISDIYEKLGFDYGVSVDHMAVKFFMEKDPITGKRIKVPLTEKEKQRRVNLTLRNSEEFIQLHKEKKYHFTPVGVVQGYDKKSFVEGVKKTISYGYDHIALGSLVQYKSEELLSILTEVSPHLNGTRLHLFGVLRPHYLEAFRKLGVTSFDSASFFRKAWLRSGQNYLAPDGNWFAAIRVPYSWNKRVLENASRMGLSEDDVKQMEKDSLKALRDFDKGKCTIEKALSTVLDYDKLLIRDSNDGDHLGEKYAITLDKKPWKTCECTLCQKLGIEIAIFRGSNRNKRRGFHNTWVFKNSELSDLEKQTQLI